MSRQAQWNNVWLTERGRSHGSKSATAMVGARFPTTAIPNSGGLASDCGFAYPLLVYWNRSLSVPLFLSLSLYSKIVPLPSPSLLLSSLSHPFRVLYSLSYTPFVVLSSTQSSRLSESASLPSATSSLLALFRLVLIALYLPTISISLFTSLHCVTTSRRPSATYTKPTGPRLLLRGSLPPASSRFTHTYTRPVYALRTRRRRDIYWQTLRMSDHAGLRISNNIAFSYTLLAPYGNNPRDRTR